MSISLISKDIFIKIKGNHLHLKISQKVFFTSNIYLLNTFYKQGTLAAQGTLTWMNTANNQYFMLARIKQNIRSAKLYKPSGVQFGSTH